MSSFYSQPHWWDKTTPNKVRYCNGDFEIYLSQQIFQPPDAEGRVTVSRGGLFVDVGGNLRIGRKIRFPDTVIVALFPWESGNAPSKRESTGLRMIAAEVAMRAEYGNSVRYSPLAEDRSTWQIGEPYIPYEILGCPIPERILVEVTINLADLGYVE